MKIHSSSSNLRRKDPSLHASCTGGHAADIAEHAEHSEAPTPDHQPGGQLSGAKEFNSSVNLPGEQLVQELLPLYEEYAPVGQAAQEVAPIISLWYPGWQNVQADSDVNCCMVPKGQPCVTPGQVAPKLADPCSHFLQKPCPCKSWYWAGGQAVHCTAPGNEPKRPGGQSVQDIAPGAEIFPEGQISQLVSPKSGWYVPASQGIHLSRDMGMLSVLVVSKSMLLPLLSTRTRAGGFPTGIASCTHSNPDPVVTLSQSERRVNRSAHSYLLCPQSTSRGNIPIGHGGRTHNTWQNPQN